MKPKRKKKNAQKLARFREAFHAQAADKKRLDEIGKRIAQIEGAGVIDRESDLELKQLIAEVEGIRGKYRSHNER